MQYKRKHNLSLNLIIVIVFTFMSEVVFACSCGVFDPEKLWEDKQLGGAEVSFPTVILVEINKVEDDKAYYDVIRVFRGEPSNASYMRSVGKSSSCYKPFQYPNNVDYPPANLQVGDQLVLFHRGVYPFSYGHCSTHFRVTDELIENLSRLSSLNSIRSVKLAEIISVYDGDTFRADISNYPPIVGENIGIRINGIDTPEIRGRCDSEIALAKDAQRFAEKTLRSAKVVELRNLQRGKYFRVVADVYADGINIGDQLIKEGLAVPYDGGRKTKDWCE